MFLTGYPQYPTENTIGTRRAKYLKAQEDGCFVILISLPGDIGAVPTSYGSMGVRAQERAL